MQKIYLLILLFITSSTLLYSQNNEWLVVQKDGPSLSNYNLSRVFIDDQDVLWTYNGNIIRYENNNWEEIPFREDQDEMTNGFSQDSNSVIWICTDKHIYSATSTEVLTHPLPTVNGNAIHGTIIHDSSNTMWIHYNQKLIRLTEPHEEYDYSLLTRGYALTIKYNNNKFYIGTDKDLLVFDNGTFSKYEGSAYEIGFDNQGKVWFTRHESLYYLQNDSTFLYCNNPLITYDWVSSIIAKPDSGIYLGTRQGLYETKNNKIELFETPGVDLSQYRITSICHVGNDQYITTDVGLFKREDNHYSYLNAVHLDQPFLPSNTIHSIRYNPDKGTLIGTRNGLTKYSYDKWTNLNPAITICRNKHIKDIELSHNNYAWITSPSKIVKYNFANDSSELFTPKSDSINSFTCVNQIIEDKYDNIWMASCNGTYKITETGDEYFFYSHLLNLGGTDFVSAACDSSNTIWFGAYGYIYACENDSFIKISHEDSLLNIVPGYICDIFVDENNTKYFACQEAGIVKYDNVNWELISPDNSDLTGIRFYDILAHEDVIWCATNKGLCKYENDTWTIFNTINSPLPNDTVNCVSIDGQGNKWIGTNNGLAIFNENGVTIEAPTNIEQHNETPTEYSLSQNYPNPFNNSTRIQFSVPNNVKVKIILYNILGQQIKVLYNAELPAGSYTVPFNADGLSSGVYIYSLQTDNYSTSKKMVYLK